MNARYTARAIRDVDRAIWWYENRQRGLGLDLLDEIELAIRFIIQYPRKNAIRHKPFRGYVLRRFPFCIFYTIELDEVVVHSVFHHRQNPAKQPNAGL